MADSGVINSGHEPNSVQSLLQCPFERRTLAEKLKVKELGPDQPDGLIYCEGFFVKLCAAPPKFHQPPLGMGIVKVLTVLLLLSILLIDPVL